MKLIAHRGLFSGPNKDLENHPDQIDRAIEQGFDCEIDLWLLDNNLFLGHDSPQYKIESNYLDNRTEHLWIHAKNLSALHYLLTTNHKYFWHQNDDYVITSNGIIWSYPEKPLTDKSIRLMPEWADPEFNTLLDQKCFGICSDYVLKIKDLFLNKK